jgi:hypothetical protein
MKTRLATLLFALSGVAVLAAGSQVSLPAAPDPILVGGRVYSLDTARPWAEAVAIRGDRIVGVGTSAELRQAAGASTRVIDLNGAFVTPGFKDQRHDHGRQARRSRRIRHQLDRGGAAASRRGRSGRACCTRLPAAGWYMNGTSHLSA